MGTYCVTCHNARLKTANLLLDQADPTDPATDPAVWEKVLLKVRTGMMPPATARQPDPAAARTFVERIESRLDQAAAAHPEPGLVPAVHRLNRTEYQHAIRDLLAVDALPKELDLKVYTAQTEVSSESKAAIRFYPDGSSTGGRITVASGERKYVVDVDWLTGRVSIGD